MSKSSRAKYVAKKKKEKKIKKMEPLLEFHTLKGQAASLLIETAKMKDSVVYIDEFIKTVSDTDTSCISEFRTKLEDIFNTKMKACIGSIERFHYDDENRENIINLSDTMVTLTSCVSSISDLQSEYGSNIAEADKFLREHRKVDMVSVENPTTISVTDPAFNEVVEVNDSTNIESNDYSES